MPLSIAKENIDEAIIDEVDFMNADWDVRDPQARRNLHASGRLRRACGLGMCVVFPSRTSPSSDTLIPVTTPSTCPPAHWLPDPGFGPAEAINFERCASSTRDDVNSSKDCLALSIALSAP
ncbi:hypothetical protein FIBSPDRAFT_36115 [Athelia psychrophila]|uniref:Uncharacterized protein n=1 Tax=Athelia psychrophila TaxID=1759441 RepID=A0A166FT28_9AGAM|nr:hypothetical protein FIBSPDRAFT_36115 [Fibularhizoctonia sp. CBS 109695]